MAYEDEEQLEEIRDWWRRNGRAVLIGAGAAIAIVIGWQQWGAWESRQQAAAASEYAAVLANLRDQDANAALERFSSLQDQHARSPYLAFSGLAIAAHQMRADEAQAAADTLSQVSAQAADGVFSDLVRLRRAEALMAAGQDAEALALLDPLPEGLLAGRYFELKGDLNRALGEREAAIDAYQQARELAQGQRRALVELKLGDLGERPTS